MQERRAATVNIAPLLSFLGREEVNDGEKRRKGKMHLYTDKETTDNHQEESST